MDELLEADEVFCTGTAVVISPVGSITYHGERYKCIVWFFICSFMFAVSWETYRNCQRTVFRLTGKWKKGLIIVPYPLLSNVR